MAGRRPITRGVNPGPPRRLLAVAKSLVVKYVLAWSLAGALLSVGEALFLGHLTAVVLGIDVIAAAQLPFGLLASVVAFTTPAEEGPGEEDGDDGRGGLPPVDDPLPPSGGLDVDWPRFEAEFRAYAQARDLLSV